MSNAKTPRHVKRSVPEYGNPVTKFGCGLVFDLFDKPGTDNVVVSPYSIWTALAMAENATDPHSVAGIQMKHMLQHDRVGDGLVDQWYIDTKKDIEKENKKVVISSGNAIFTTNPNLDPACVYNANAIFASGVFKLTGREDINSFVSDHTEKMIPKLLTEDPDGPTILINAVYFKAQWTKKFDPLYTRDGFFHPFGRDRWMVGRNDRNPCKMMNMDKDMVYGETPKFQMIKLDYGDKDTDEFSAFIALPNRGNPSENNDQTLVNDTARYMFSVGSPDNWVELFNMRHRKVNLLMPRFEVSGGVDNLKDYMQKNGVSELFKPGGLINMALCPDDCIYDVIHHAVIRVDEEGTTAAAATAVVATRGMPPPSTVVRVDRPFIFAVIHNPTKTLIFVARVNSVCVMQRCRLGVTDAGWVQQMQAGCTR